ncbi:unnamed protein product [Rotaria sp. Silwood1]|nr:unnamed protein product [Rotaria sp. Silwood1]
MKTPCLTSSTTIMTTTREILNLFDSHGCSTSALKTLTTATTIPANILTTTASILSTSPVVSIFVQPTLSKIATSHKRSSTPKLDHHHRHQYHHQ